MRTEPIFLVCGLGIILLSAAVGSDRFHRVGPSEIYPDAVRTPGTGNPDITQQNIKDTICTRHWSTRTVRPPPQYTSKLKRRQLREYGDTVHQGRAELINSSTGKVDITRCPLRSDNTACYEEDHLISLEDGGNPAAPTNRWPVKLLIDTLDSCFILFPFKGGPG